MYIKPFATISEDVLINEQKTLTNDKGQNKGADEVRVNQIEGTNDCSLNNESITAEL